MAVDAAASANDVSESVVAVGEDRMAELTRQVARLNLGSELRQLSASVDVTSPSVAKMVDVFEQWLIKKSSCPVTYTWTDLGDYFWPRFIKQGKCAGDDSGKRRGVSHEEDDYDDDDDIDDKPAAGGCSWPEGMKCVQGESKVLHLLRWHCRRRKKSSSTSGGQRRKCKWYKVPYPVTSSCKCACQ
jgi:noggin